MLGHEIKLLFLALLDLVYACVAVYKEDKQVNKRYDIIPP